MRAAFVSSVSASIHRRSTGGNLKNSATHSRYFPILKRKSFAVTMSCIPAQDRKARTLHDPRSF